MTRRHRSVSTPVYVTRGPIPLVSVLITTFNRSRLVPRAINSVLNQTFDDFEIVVIDDCSTDDTREVIARIHDPRIRYIRNDVNVGATHGDRAHVRRFVYELMRGKYFVYLCDDDYWLPCNLLERQVWMHETNPDLAFVFGNQLSHVLTTQESYLGGAPDRPITLTREKLSDYFDFTNNRSRSPHLSFCPKLFPKELMTSEEYLWYFSSEPTTYNRIVGATLYSRARFIESGAMRGTNGSAWQAGYEFLMGPACVGGVGCIDEPAILTEIREQNASFRGTQLDHYLDSVKSIELAFSAALASGSSSQRTRFLRRIKTRTIRNLTRAFLGNTVTIRGANPLMMCSAEHMAKPVTARHVLPVYRRNGVWPHGRDIALLYQAKFVRGWIPLSSSTLGLVAR